MFHLSHILFILFHNKMNAFVDKNHHVEHVYMQKKEEEEFVTCGKYKFCANAQYRKFII